MDHMGIIGGGAWGTALAVVARRAGRQVTMWALEDDTVAAINERGENPGFLPGVELPPGIHATKDLSEAAAADAVLLVTPAQFLRATAAALAPAMAAATPVVVCAKGIEQKSGALMSEAAGAALPGHALAVLSGPTFAAEVARGLPTAVTLAAPAAATGDALVAALGGTHFRPYRSTDVIGAEIGGAMKNVIAIACGITEGRGLGENARAALITRGLAEMTRLCVEKGGRAETMMGLSGLGDLTLTCSSTKSRNYSLGAALGAGETLDAVLGRRRSVAEGVHSAAAVSELAASLGIEMPISAAVDAILNRGADIDEVIAELLRRPFRTEH